MAEGTGCGLAGAHNVGVYTRAEALKIVGFLGCETLVTGYALASRKNVLPSLSDQKCRPLVVTCRDNLPGCKLAANFFPTPSRRSVLLAVRQLATSGHVLDWKRVQRSGTCCTISYSEGGGVDMETTEQTKAM